MWSGTIGEAQGAANHRLRPGVADRYARSGDGLAGIDRRALLRPDEAVKCHENLRPRLSLPRKRFIGLAPVSLECVARAALGVTSRRR